MKFKVGDKVIAKEKEVKLWISQNINWWLKYPYIKNIKTHVFTISELYNYGAFKTECGRVLAVDNFILCEDVLTKEQQIINKIQWLYKNSKCELEKKWVKE